MSGVYLFFVFLHSWNAWILARAACIVESVGNARVRICEWVVVVNGVSVIFRSCGECGRENGGGREGGRGKKKVGWVAG